MLMKHLIIIKNIKLMIFDYNFINKNNNNNNKKIMLKLIMKI